MTILPDNKIVQVKDNLFLRQNEIEIRSEELNCWLRKQYNFIDPVVYLCIDEDGEITGIMCVENDDLFFESGIRFFDVSLEDETVTIQDVD